MGQYLELRRPVLPIRLLAVVNHDLSTTGFEVLQEPMLMEISPVGRLGFSDITLKALLSASCIHV